MSRHGYFANVFASIFDQRRLPLGFARDERHILTNAAS